MQYLHTMVRVGDLEKSLDFYCNKLGLREIRRTDNEQGRFTLVFLAAPADVQRLQCTYSAENGGLRCFYPFRGTTVHIQA
jgi:lactoylglutathione lyase